MNSIFERLAFYSMLQIIGFGLVAGLLYYFIAYDDGSVLQRSIATISQEIQTEEVKKTDTEATLRQEATMKASVGELSAQYSEIAKQLPSTLMSIDINRGIDSFARSSGVSVKSKRPAELIKKEIVDEVPVDVSLEGTYGELAQFVYYVSTSEKLSRVRNFVISPSQEPKSKKLIFEGQIVGYKIGTGEKAQ